MSCERRRLCLECLVLWRDEEDDVVDCLSAASLPSIVAAAGAGGGGGGGGVGSMACCCVAGGVGKESCISVATADSDISITEESCDSVLVKESLLDFSTMHSLSCVDGEVSSSEELKLLSSGVGVELLSGVSGPISLNLKLLSVSFRF